jgi:hypothetical protein
MTAPTTTGPTTGSSTTGPVGTATGPTVRSVVRSARGPVAMVVLLVLGGLLLAALRGTGDGGYLDPDAYDPPGAHALRALLEDAGVEVVRLEGTDELAGRASSSTTVLVADAAAMRPGQLADLLTSAAGAELVLVGAGQDVFDTLDVGAEVRGDADVSTRRPACDLPAAVRAGEVEIGGYGYGGSRPASQGVSACYAFGGAAPLLRLQEPRVTLLGDGELLTNEALDEKGHAALGLGLLGTQPTLLWVMPDPLEGATEDEGRSLWSLYDKGLRVAVLGLGLAVLVLALWRARRLGRVVVEPLPVVVRAAEAVEGRGRLYQAARARGQAAESLRAGARDRLVRRLGLPLDSGREALVETVALQSGRDPGGVDVLLYGAAPVDDAALVRLADDLDSLTLEVARS